MGAIQASTIKNLSQVFTPTGELDIDKTCKFLDISKTELATAFKMKADQLRNDRLTSRTKERIKELGGAIEIIAEEFKGDLEKTKFWFNAPNRNFGGITPKKIILNGRFKKIFKFLQATQEGY